MGYFRTFDLDVVDNQNFRAWLPCGGGSRSSKFVQGSQFGSAIHVAMLYDAQVIVGFNEGKRLTRGIASNPRLANL